MAYAKVMEKMGNQPKVVEALEHAVEMEPNPQTFTLLAEAYEANGQSDEAKKLKKKSDKLIMPAGRPKRIRQPRKVVM